MGRRPKGFVPPTVDEMLARARENWERSIIALWEAGVCSSPLAAHEMLLRHRSDNPRPITEYKMRTT